MGKKYPMERSEIKITKDKNIPLVSVVTRPIIVLIL